MGDPVSALAVIGVAEGGKALLQGSAASAEEEAIELRTQQSILQNQQKTLSNYDVLQKVIDRQILQATTKGIKLSSPSFDAIERNTFNVGAKEANNLKLERDFIERNADVEESNVRKTLYAQLFGDIAETGLAAFKLTKE